MRDTFQEPCGQRRLHCFDHGRMKSSRLNLQEDRDHRVVTFRSPGHLPDKARESRIFLHSSSSTELPDVSPHGAPPRPYLNVVDYGPYGSARALSVYLFTGYSILTPLSPVEPVETLEYSALFDSRGSAPGYLITVRLGQSPFKFA